MRAKGYGAYRGRPRWKTVLKIVLVTLLLLVVLAAALMVYLERYLVVTGEGVRLELPFFQNQEQEQEQVSPSPTPGQSEPVVVVTPTPVPTPTVLEPVSLELTSLLAGTAAQETAAAGGNAALFDMKSDSGALAYVSSVERAVSGGLSADDPTLNGAITSALEEEGLYAIARVSCFKDNDLSNEDRSLAVTTNSGYRWTDPEGIRWVSPTSAEVRDYITEVCVELAELGFDEIMLDNAGYPPEGNLHYIRTMKAPSLPSSEGSMSRWPPPWSHTIQCCPSTPRRRPWQVPTPSPVRPKKTCMPILLICGCTQGKGSMPCWPIRKIAQRD